MYDKLIKRIEEAKKTMMPKQNLYMVYGEIKMALELKAITIDEFMKLNHLCIYEGINNPNYY